MVRSKKNDQTKLYSERFVFFECVGGVGEFQQGEEGQAQLVHRVRLGSLRQPCTEPKTYV